MQLAITPEYADFVDGDVLAGRYRLRDEFKPFVHPLNTPAGYTVSHAMPHDHRHHKGLMFSLRIAGLNFWEETSTLPGERVGRQRHVEFHNVAAAGAEIGFEETLSWEPVGGGPAAFREQRTLRCRRAEDAFVWTWISRLEPLAACQLIQSQWATVKPDGRKVNYHGLAVRLDWPMMLLNRLELDGHDAKFDEAMGARAARVVYEGSLDPGYPNWPPPRVAVTLEQQHGYALFVRTAPFPIFAMGPTTLGSMSLKAGEVLECAYTVRVRDCR